LVPDMAKAKFFDLETEVVINSGKKAAKN
jgi:hypothetical protein